MILVVTTMKRKVDDLTLHSQQCMTTIMAMQLQEKQKKQKDLLGRIETAEEAIARGQEKLISDSTSKGRDRSNTLMRLAQVRRLVFIYFCACNGCLVCLCKRYIQPWYVTMPFVCYCAYSIV